VQLPVVWQTLQQVADELIGHSVFVGWPHLFEALVESVATDEMQYVLLWFFDMLSLAYRVTFVIVIY